MFQRSSSRVAWSLRRWAASGIVLLVFLSLVSYGASTALVSTTKVSADDEHAPIIVTVFSPGQGDHAGVSGAGFVIDISLDAARPADNGYLSAAKGYMPYFNDPSSSTFHPGADPGAPGLVVLLSTTENIPGTLFVGPGTNLAGLFQINGVSKANDGTIAETWNTWQVGKAIAGSGIHSILTVFVVKGKAPAAIHGNPENQYGLISNIIHIPFMIAS
jgi:hypothetical protein